MVPVKFANFSCDQVDKEREITIEQPILRLYSVSMDIFCYSTNLRPRNLASHDRYKVHLSPQGVSIVLLSLLEYPKWKLPAI